MHDTRGWVQKSSLWMTQTETIPVTDRNGKVNYTHDLLLLMSASCSSQHLAFSVPTGDVAEIAAAVTSLWEWTVAQIERKGGSNQPDTVVQIIPAAESTWQVTAAGSFGPRVHWGDKGEGARSSRNVTDTLTDDWQASSSTGRIRGTKQNHRIRPA